LEKFNKLILSWFCLKQRIIKTVLRRKSYAFPENYHLAVQGFVLQNK
jgi:hypothetical protein